MAGRAELIWITSRNLKAVKECEIKSKSTYEKAYFRGKSDSLEHFLSLLTEGEGN